VQVFSKFLLTAVLKLGLTGVCVRTSYLCKPACVLPMWKADAEVWSFVGKGSRRGHQCSCPSQMDKVGSLRGTRRGIDARRGHGDAVCCSRIASRHGWLWVSRCRTTGDMDCVSRGAGYSCNRGQQCVEVTPRDQEDNGTPVASTGTLENTGRFASRHR